MGKKGMGWVPDYPDVRDCTLSHEKVKRIQSNAPDSSGHGGSDDRAQQLLTLIAILEQTLPNRNIVHQLPKLKEECQREAAEKRQEADQKLHFISATFTEGFLSLGSEGKEVQDLQDKLRKLKYLEYDSNQKEFKYHHLESDRSGYYGRATEAAVKEFQTNQLPKDPNGIYTPFTKAELLAWVSIVGKLGQSTYGLGVSGPGVIYIHALLQITHQLKADEPIDLFGKETSKAVQKLQRDRKPTQSRKEESKDLNKKTEIGTVDQRTWDTLLENENRYLRAELPNPPVSKKKFDELKEKICKVIEDFGKKHGETADESEKIATASAPINAKRLRSEERLEPIIEVLIQLAPCIGKNIFFEAAIEKGYLLLLSMIPLTQDSNPFDQLVLLAQRLERGKGYVSTKIFRYDSYAPGVSGPAVTYIQERLRAMGYYNGPTTGYFDEQLTQDAIKKFQLARLKQSTLQSTSPADGTFKREDMDYLTGITEQFINLEPPLPGNLTDSLVADLGGLEKLVDSFSETAGFKTIDGIVSKVKEASKSKTWVKLIQTAIPMTIVDRSTEEALKEIAQGLKDSGMTAEEKWDLAKRFLGLMLGLALQPIAKVIAQIISPIGKYNAPQEAFKDGLKRFRVIAYFSQIQTIDRVLNGLIVDVSGDIDGLTKEYEPLVETLAILKAEFRQPELPGVGLEIFEQLQSLVIVSLESIKPVAAKNANPIEQFIRQVKNWLAKQLFVDVDRYVKLGSKTKHSTIKNAHDTIPRRDQTFIRVDPECDRCALQLPVTGKMQRALSQLPQIPQQAGEGNTTYTTYLILPDAVDLSIWCSDVEDQGELDACTAHAGVALLEYFEKKSFGNALDASSRFLYKVTRNLMHREGDTGASVRETMKAMVLFGVPPEEYCPYDEAKFDDDPSAFCYAFAQNYQTITYFRLDGAGMPARELLAQIKTILVGGFPCMFGFTVYDSIHDKTNPPGHIPYPTLDDKQEGGHAAIAVGYNDYKQIKNATNPGALLIKNSWGADWGEGGYGWLPYDYVLNGLARDWWSLIKSEWVESKQFGLSSPDAWTANLGRIDSGTPPSGTPPC